MTDHAGHSASGSVASYPVTVARCELSDADQVRAFYADEYSVCVGLGLEPAPGDRFYVTAEQLRLGPVELTQHDRAVEMAFQVGSSSAGSSPPTWNPC